MSTCATRGSRRVAAAALCLALVAAGRGAAAEGVELVGEATLGARVYDLEDPFWDDELTSFLERYRYIRTKDSEYPYFADVMHLDLGLARDDGTYLLRAERTSPNWLNDRAEINLDWLGLAFDFGYRRYRSDELRVFPTGTRAVAPFGQMIFPFFGSVYNADGEFFDADGTLFDGRLLPGSPLTVPDNPLGANQRFWVRRTGVDGEISLRPDGFGLANPLLAEVSAGGWYERRTGYRQDRFLLDDTVEPIADQTKRWRGVRRELDQEVTGARGGLVLSPFDLFTADVDVQYERFREHAPILRFGEMAITDPNIDRLAVTVGNPQIGDRAFHFVPDTQRVTGTLRVSRRLWGATIHGGGFVTRISQAGRRAPLQNRNDIPDNEVTTYSLHGAIDVPLGRWFGINGYYKFVRRRNDTDPSAFELISTDRRSCRVNVTPCQFLDADQPQVGVYIARRSEYKANLELVMKPLPGSLLGIGYRERKVDRDLQFGNPLGVTAVTPLGPFFPTGLNVIRPELAFIRDESKVRTGYLRMRTRLMRTLQLSGEVGYESAAEIGLPRELESLFYAEGRGSMTVPGTPVSLSFWGRYRNGENDRIDVEVQGVPAQQVNGLPTPGIRQEKDFRRRQWSYGGTITAIPTEDVVVFGSYAHHHDEQRFAYLRSNNPRYLPFPVPQVPPLVTPPPALRFFLDSRPGLESDVRTILAGGTWQITPRVDLALNGSVTWTRVDFFGNGSSGYTASILDRVNEIRNRIVSIDARLGVQVVTGLKVFVGYRFEDFHDARRRAGPLSLETHVNVFSAGLTLDMGVWLP